MELPPRNDAIHYTEEQRSQPAVGNWGRSMLRPRQGHSELTGSSTRGAFLLIVCAGAIEARNRNAQQAIVHGQLPAVMDDVVKDHGAKTSHARHRKDRL